MAATTEEKKAAFNEAVEHVLMSWTSLTLAVTHSWGGRHSEKKREELYNLILKLFYSPSAELIEHDGKRISCGSIIASNENLADFLLDKLETEFHIDIDDEDPHSADEFLEVADILRRLASSLKASDFTYYNQVMNQRSDGHLKSVAAAIPQGHDLQQSASDECGEDEDGSASGSEDEDMLDD